MTFFLFPLPFFQKIFSCTLFFFYLQQPPPPTTIIFCIIYTLLGCKSEETNSPLQLLFLFRLGEYSLFIAKTKPQSVKKLYKIVCRGLNSLIMVKLPSINNEHIDNTFVFYKILKYFRPKKNFAQLTISSNDFCKYVKQMDYKH